MKKILVLILFLVLGKSIFSQNRPNAPQPTYLNDLVDTTNKIDREILAAIRNQTATVISSGSVVVTNTVNVIANAGTNLNTSALALSANQINGTQQTKITDGTNINTIKTLSTQVIGSDYGLVTNSVIHGLTTGGGGGYVDVKVNPSGALATDNSGVVQPIKNNSTDTTNSRLNQCIEYLTTINNTNKKILNAIDSMNYITSIAYNLTITPTTTTAVSYTNVTWCLATNTINADAANVFSVSLTSGSWQLVGANFITTATATASLGLTFDVIMANTANAGGDQQAVSMTATQASQVLGVIYFRGSTAVNNNWGGFVTNIDMLTNTTANGTPMTNNQIYIRPNTTAVFFEFINRASTFAKAAGTTFMFRAIFKRVD